MSAPGLIIRAAPAGHRNGLHVIPYVYKGTGEDTRTAFMDDEPDEPLAPEGRVLRPCGTDAAVRRHRRKDEPLCEACQQREIDRSREREAASVASGKTARAVHASNGGRPWCGSSTTIGEPVIATPGQAVTCRRCLKAMGRAS